MPITDTTPIIPDMRVGNGYDVHAFADVGNSVMLGGVRIPHNRSLLAHSDGDVLLHALCDAVLGAAALGDIGRHFPDDDPAYANADSRVLLRNVMSKVRDLGFKVSNIDSTIIAQRPKMSSHIELMRRNIAEDCGLSVDRVNVKATTTEKLGFTGREEGIACQAAVLLVKESDS